MIKVLFAATPERWTQYEAPLLTAFRQAGLHVDLRLDHKPETVEYIIYAPNSELQDFAVFTRCKAVLNLWAGVEQITDNPTLTQPLCRMVDPGLTQGMIEWVTGHVLRYHLNLDHWMHRQDGSWNPKSPPLASQRNVTLLGLGALGQACAQTLATLGFQVTGWARRQKDITGITCLSGSEGLNKALSAAEILVLLLPDTPATNNILNENTLAALPKGARLINPGRGPLIDDAALLTALDSGHVAHATLDVFRQEPLPAEHPYWKHPNVTVTPHIAAETRAETASGVIAENISRGESGREFLHRVNRSIGY